MAKLNNLTGKEWIQFTKSWFKISFKSRTKDEVKHPAKYPEELVDEFVKFFTFPGELVFDPFLGVGSTILSAERLGRKGCGIEINSEFANFAKTRCSADAKIIIGDSRTSISKIKNDSIDFIMTSPPYWNILSKKRGHSDSQHGDREKKGLQLTYSDLVDDLSNINDYDLFLNELVKLFNQCYIKLKNNKYMVVVVQNFRNNDGHYITFAWDLVAKLNNKFDICGEKIWLQDDKKLGIWGYPSTFVPNIHHHYCLIFKKNEKIK